MESITKNQLRIGNFTSSEIYKLMSNGKTKGTMGAPAITYIEDKNYERKLGRGLNNESNARALEWGKAIEDRAFNLLGLDYVLNSQETNQHPEIPYWSGSCDGLKFDEGKTVIDIKCPFTLKSFCELVECKTIDELRENHKDGEKYYWQLVSNAIINDCQWAELIVYVPYLSELEEIKEEVNIAFINYATNEELPYILDGGIYSNINIIRFEVPEADKIWLRSRVIEAGKLLITELNKAA